MVLKKKNILAILIFAAFIAGLGYGVKQSIISSKETSVANSSHDEPFSNNLLPGEAMEVSAINEITYKHKNDREEIRSKACEILRIIINNKSSSEKAKKEAEEKLLKMADDINKEAQIETLLSAKGLKEAVVFISESSVSVTIAANELSDDEIAKINDIVFEISGNNNVKIVEVN